MHKFAHIADCHIGAQSRKEGLQEIEVKSFNSAIDACIKEKVDFIVISGDFLHSNIPDLQPVKEVTKKLKEVKDLEIPIYIIYGSHDFSPGETSLVDVLCESGLLVKIGNAEVIEGKIVLEILTDRKTGAKITGLGGRKLGLERVYYQNLNRDILENAEGFKIFAFHSGIDELKPAFLNQMDSIPISFLPKGFDYYAGGHIHKMQIGRFKEHSNVVYPGTLFASSYRDLEDMAKGDKRGFYIVEFDKAIKNIRFMELPVCDFCYLEIDAAHKNSEQVNKEITNASEKTPCKGKIVIIKIKGELSSGKTSDIKLNELRMTLYEKKAIYVGVSSTGLSTKEFDDIKIDENDPSKIEEQLFRESIGSFKFTNKKLNGSAGAELAIDLVKLLKNPQNEEKKADYEARILKEAVNLLNFEE